MRLLRKFVELNALRSSTIARQLGYVGTRPFVMFSYCRGGGEVIWRDGHSSGFGFGGWRSFLWEIAPLASRHGASLATESSIGKHVLLMDLVRKVVYTAPREAAEEFLAWAYRVPLSTRPCLCSRSDCAVCPERTCAHAGLASRPAGGQSVRCR